jgi:hypothetical protein
MTTPATPADSPSLEQRLANLEAQNRSLRFAVAAIALGMVLYAAWHMLFAGPIRATVVEAQRVVVRDPEGHIRLVLGTGADQPDAFNAIENPGLLLFDEQGALRARLSATEEVAGLRLFDPDGRPRALVTHGKVTSGVWLKDRQGAIRAALALDASGPRLDILDEDQRPEFRKP